MSADSERSAARPSSHHRRTLTERAPERTREVARRREREPSVGGIGIPERPIDHIVRGARGEMDLRRDTERAPRGHRELPGQQAFLLAPPRVGRVTALTVEHDEQPVIESGC